MTRITGTRRFAALCMTLAAGAFANTAWAISASLTAPAAGAVFQAGATITLTATATPTNSSRPIVKVEFFRGTTLIGTDTTSPYSFAWTNVPAGSYSLTAKATDSTGATATSAARSIKVNAPPTVNLTAPANNAVFNSGSTIALAATAADRSEEHTSELQSHSDLVCRLLLEKKKKNSKEPTTITAPAITANTP